MIFEMLRWWYSTGWLQAIHRISSWTRGVERAFSASLLAKTLFAPWRRIVSVSGRSLDDKIRAALDNFVSRCVGFVVRLLVLIVAGFSVLGALLSGIIMSIIWPLLPLALAYFVLRGITG